MPVGETLIDWKEGENGTIISPRGWFWRGPNNPTLDTFSYPTKKTVITTISLALLSIIPLRLIHKAGQQGERDRVGFREELVQDQNGRPDVVSALYARAREIAQERAAQGKKNPREVNVQIYLENGTVRIMDDKYLTPGDSLETK